MTAHTRFNIKEFYFVSLCCLLILLPVVGCNKLVQVPNPISSATANQIFNSDGTATAAVLGIYSYMSSQESFSSYYSTYRLGNSGDELRDQPIGYESYDLYLTNNLTALGNSGQVLSEFWQPAYYDIYSANAIILGVQASTGISASVGNELIGEAKFIRAFCYFYLTNIFGDIPLVLTPDFNQTVLLAKAPQAQIYKQVLNDLLDAQNLMISDFSLSGGMPNRANKWTATALLARVYQYQGEWQSADSASNAVINSGNFRLVYGLDSVFLANSAEAILQLQINSFPYVTWDGYNFIPFRRLQRPGCWLSTQLLSAFEPGDFRRLNWVDSAEDYTGTLYYYPFKYKFNEGSSSDVQESYMLLRFAEQYLIRAESEANLNQLGAAINDINIIRNRAGLDSLSSSLTQPQILRAVQQEYFVEFFAEWGHRWLDLKRWGIALSTLDTIPYKTQYIDSSQLLYPIPVSEIQIDPNLTQNFGY